MTTTYDEAQTRLRAMQFIEEAVGLVQDVGLTKEQMHGVVDHVVYRENRSLEQKLDDVGGTLYGLTKVLGLSTTSTASTESTKMNRLKLAIQEANRDYTELYEGQEPLNVSKLTEKQLKIAAAVIIGGTLERIACTESISEHTVRNHLKAIYRTLGVAGKSELIVRFWRDTREHMP